MTDSLEQGNKSLRPEEAAAIANAGLVLAAPFVLAALLRMNEPERAVVIGWVSGPAPDPMLSWFVRAATSMVPAAPMAALATWRTNVHARRVRAGQGRWWQGVAEAIAAGALVPMIVLLPIIVSRGLTGLAYALPPPCCSRRAACLAPVSYPRRRT